MGTKMTVPGEEIIKQSTGWWESREMYFIVKGTVSVTVDADKEIIDKNTEETRILHEGDHFGEIALCRICPRTATVISKDYSTLGSMSYDAFL
jgi:CRP-like cAMP-binding protein